MAYKNILIVDDEENLTAALDSFFRSKGHNIYIANSGEAALDFLKKQKVDVLMLDLNMPGMDGVEVAKTVKKKYPDTKILILTAYSEEYEKKLASLKVEAIMTKPFGVLTLINKVQELLGEPISPEVRPEAPSKFRPVRVLFIDPAMSYILKDYVLPYIRLSWVRNIEVEAMQPTSGIAEKLTVFKPDIVLLSTVLTKQAEEISKDIANGIYKPKEVIIYNAPDETTAEKSPAVAYYDMQGNLMDPAYLNRLNELIKEIAIKHKLIDESVFKRERPRLPQPLKTFTANDIANFVKEAIKETLSLKDIELKDNTSFVEDLGVDSLETIELTMALEEVFGLELPDEDTERLKTVGDAIEYIKKRVDLEELAKRKRTARKLLIIDDQEGMCKFLENYFLSKGYDALSTARAKQAPALVKKENPDVVLLDIKMPDMDGIDVLKKIKEIRPSTKVIMVSVALEREEEARRYGADAFISKPFPITYLEETVIKKIKELTSQE